MATKVRTAIGWLLVLLVGGLMVFAGIGKATGNAPPDVAEGLATVGLTPWMTTIGCGAMATGVLLILPWTSSVGVLLASSYWGGAIVTHMSLGDSIMPPSVLLALSWIGTTLRDPRTLSSFWPRPSDAIGVEVAERDGAEGVQPSGG